MAGMAERCEVVFIMGAALRQRTDVVDFRRRGIASALRAFLAQRMRFDVPGADFLPRAAVTLVDSRVALVLVIPAVLRLLVPVAVQAVRQVRTALVLAWCLGFVRHVNHLSYMERGRLPVANVLLGIAWYQYKAL